MMARQQQKIGEQGEQLAESRLRSIGFEMIEKIGTPVKMASLPQHGFTALRKVGINPKMVRKVIFGEKVAGDRRAIIPPLGRSVLIETKTILARNLRWSDLRPHQPGKLDEHSIQGGVSLIAWVHESGVYILQWPVTGFEKGKSISPEKADQLSITEIKQCR